VFKQSFTNTKIINTSTDERENIIKELKSKKSCGYDEIMTKNLKIRSHFFVSPLIYIYIYIYIYICNRMFSTGTFLDRLKFSEIKLIFKKDLLTNYRPNSLLPIFSKNLKKIIYNTDYINI
jgi:hypothetical protein